MQSLVDTDVSVKHTFSVFRAEDRYRMFLRNVGLSTSLHGTETQENDIIFTVLETSYHTQRMPWLSVFVFSLLQVDVAIVH
jgi:hypothetical protein